MNTVRWRNYHFYICDFYGPWKDDGGVYIFSGFDQRNGWEALYVGKTGSFRNRIPCHERWVEAAGLGATNVLAMLAPADLQARVEQALIEEFQPPLNVQLRSPISWTDLFQLPPNLSR